MSGGRKRVCAGSSMPGGSKHEQTPPSKKRAIAAKTVEKWKKEYDKELDIATWLCYKNKDRDHVLKSIKLLRMHAVSTETRRYA